MKFRNKKTGEIVEWDCININSSLVSAQNRVRLYWTNIQGITQPEDKGLVLADIIEDGKAIVEKGQTILATIYKENAKSMIKRKKKDLLVERPCEPREFKSDSLCHHAANATDLNGNESIKRVYAETGKSPTLTTMCGGHREPKVLVGRMVGRKINPETGKRDDYNPDLVAEQRIEPRLDEKSGTLTTVQKDNLLINASSLSYRKLTPLECERLQTVPDGYTELGRETLVQDLFDKQENECQVNVASKSVVSHSQAGKLNSAINTILDILDMEQQSYLNSLSIKAKSVLQAHATGSNKRLKVTALSTISNGKELSQSMKVNDVRFVMNQLEKGRAECVLSTIAENSEGQTLLKVSVENSSLTEMMEKNTIKTLMVNGLIEELQKRLLVESSEREKLYITLTLTNLIIAQAILSFYQTQNISLCIDSSSRLQGNLLETSLLSLKMENTIETSKSNRYKMLGNGWTVDVIAHILSHIKW